MYVFPFDFFPRCTGNPLFRLHARTLKHACRVNVSSHCYITEIPMWDSTMSSKIAPSIPFMLPFSKFVKEFDKHPERYTPSGNDAATYWQQQLLKHEVCKRHGAENCFPMGLYADEVPYQTSQGRRDSFLVITWNSLRSPETRQLVCVARARDKCQCGCKGQDTMAAYGVW